MVDTSTSANNGCNSISSIVNTELKVIMVVAENHPLLAQLDCVRSLQNKLVCTLAYYGFFKNFLFHLSDAMGSDDQYMSVKPEPNTTLMLLKGIASRSSYQLSNMVLACRVFSVELLWNRPISALLKPSSYARTVHSKQSWLEISCSVFRLITAS